MKDKNIIRDCFDLLAELQGFIAPESETNARIVDLLNRLAESLGRDDE